MGDRPTRIPPDGTWRPYANEPAFRSVLDGVAQVWGGLLRLRLAAPGHHGVSMAYDRAVLALAQLPIEYEGPGSRFMRSRWRSSDVVPGEDVLTTCEHPWTKMRTKDLVLVAGMVALGRELPPEAFARGVSEILAARQDTVLLPRKYAHLEVVSERRGEGLLGRYAPAVRAGKLVLIDRATRDLQPLAAPELERIEEGVTRAVLAGVEVLAGPRGEWSHELARAVAAATGEPAGGPGAGRGRRRATSVGAGAPEALEEASPRDASRRALTEAEVLRLRTVERMLVELFGEPNARVDRESRYPHRRLTWDDRGPADLYPQRRSTVVVASAVEQEGRKLLNGSRGVVATASGSGTRIRIDDDVDLDTLSLALKKAWGSPGRA